MLSETPFNYNGYKLVEYQKRVMEIQRKEHNGLKRGSILKLEECP